MKHKTTKNLLNSLAEDNVRDALGDKLNLGQHYTAEERGRYTKPP